MWRPRSRAMPLTCIAEVDTQSLRSTFEVPVLSIGVCGKAIPGPVSWTTLVSRSSKRQTLLSGWSGTHLVPTDNAGTYSIHASSLAARKVAWRAFSGRGAVELGDRHRLRHRCRRELPRSAVSRGPDSRAPCGRSSATESPAGRWHLVAVALPQLHGGPGRRRSCRQIQRGLPVTGPGRGTSRQCRPRISVRFCCCRPPL